MNQRQREILCIDDDLQSLQVRRILLETYGFSVVIALGAKEGLKAFRRRAVDAVIMDYHMPEIDGGQAALLMKRLRPNVPVMILSALPWLPEQAPRECIDDFVCKGESTAVLVRKIQALLAARPRPPRTSKLLARVALAGRLAGLAARHLRGIFSSKNPAVAAPQRVTEIPAGNRGPHDARSWRHGMAIQP
jgi:CheY-like chemotaxis protein